MSVKIQVMTIPGAPLEGLNPLPMFHQRKLNIGKIKGEFPDWLSATMGIRERFLPYKRQDRYSRKRLPLKMKTIVMENEYLKAVFWPENGGKLYSLFDKVNNRDLLMTNCVYQPGNLAIRNAWHSGGIEFNFGNIGHHYFTCDNLFVALLKDEQGNDFVRMYEFERAKSTLFQIDFHLPEGSPVLYSHVKVFNPNTTDTTTYWWTNIAIPEDGNTRVLSNTNKVLVMGEYFSYEELPHLSPFGDEDMSYPHNASRGYDHFYQTPADAKSAWEAGADDKGNVFFDRSTAPMLYHKMFCWGNHSAAQRWQDHLSEPGKGNYIEIQAGFTHSQGHDMIFPANGTIEWTQCYGGAVLDRDTLHQEDMNKAADYVESYLDTVISEEDLLNTNEYFKKLATMEVKENDLIHLGSGWGALEEMRIAAKNDVAFPKSVCFPKATIGEDQYPWYALLTEGKMPEESPNVIPPSWMVPKKWLAILEDSIKASGETWYNMMHYGVMLYENLDDEHIAAVACNWPEYPKYVEMAKNAFLRSIELEPSVWAYRCLSCIAQEEGNDEMAEYYYDKVFELEAATIDFAFAAEYMTYLNKMGKYEKSWAIFESMPENIKNVDRMMLCASNAAIKLRKLDFIPAVFEREYADIREGETSLTDIWFEFNALKMAKERGLGDDIQGEELEALIDEAWDACPPPRAIDFRMSFSRVNRYRVEA